MKNWRTTNRLHFRFRTYISLTLLLSIPHHVFFKNWKTTKPSTLQFWNIYVSHVGIVLVGPSCFNQKLKDDDSASLLYTTTDRFRNWLPVNDPWRLFQKYTNYGFRPNVRQGGEHKTTKTQTAVSKVMRRVWQELMIQTRKKISYTTNNKHHQFLPLRWRDKTYLICLPCNERPTARSFLSWLHKLCNTWSVPVFFYTQRAAHASGR